MSEDTPVRNVTRVIEDMIERREQLKGKSVFVVSAGREREQEQLNTAITILDYMMSAVLNIIQNGRRADPSTFDNPEALHKLETRFAWVLQSLGDDDETTNPRLARNNLSLRTIASQLVGYAIELDSPYLRDIYLTLRIAAQHLYFLHRAHRGDNVNVYRLALTGLGYDLDSGVQTSELENSLSNERK